MPFLLEAEGETVSVPFPAPRGHGIPWLLAPSSISKASNILQPLPLTLASTVTPPSDSPLRTLWLHRVHQIIQDHLPRSEFLITPAEPLLPRQGLYFQVLEVGM